LYICGFLRGGGERRKPISSLKLLLMQQLLTQPGGHEITLVVVQQGPVQLEGHITTVRQQDIVQPGWQYPIPRLIPIPRAPIPII